MKRLALSLIKLYQRRLSPHKGFCCAYRAHTGHASCSALGYRAIQRFGVWRGIAVLRQRLGKCGVAHRRHAIRPAAMHRQAGFCDLSCDLPCDQPCDLDVGDLACDGLSNCGAIDDCGDWGSSKKKRQKDDTVHIPPNTRFGPAVKSDQ